MACWCKCHHTCAAASNVHHLSVGLCMCTSMHPQHVSRECNLCADMTDIYVCDQCLPHTSPPRRTVCTLSCGHRSLPWAAKPRPRPRQAPQLQSAPHQLPLTLKDHQQQHRTPVQKPHMHQCHNLSRLPREHPYHSTQALPLTAQSAA